MDVIQGTLLVVIIYLLYKFAAKEVNYWKKRGVPYLKPLPLFGNTLPLLMKRKSDTEHSEDMYKHFEGHRFGGVWFFMQPALLIRDTELIKAVTVKDFEHFMNRNVVIDEELDPIFAKNLLTIRDQKWRNMRNILSPTFTSAKIKIMFHLVNECGTKMTNHINDLIQKQMDTNHPDGNVLHLEFKSFFTMFTSDVIATSAFGLEVNSFKDPQNEFYLCGKEIADFSGRKFFIALFRFVAPYLAKMLKLTFFPGNTSQFMRDLVIGTMKRREEENIIRPDVLHLLMVAKKELMMKKIEEKDNVEELSEDDLTAQVVLFLIAGFDTTSTFLSFTAYELAVNKDVQTRLQEEIDRVIAEDDDKITYDGVSNKMVYLNMVVNETLRKWPPLNMVDRLVSRRYTIPQEGDEPEVILEKGDVIVLPIQGLHHDPKYFPNPEKFDPERFSEENKHNIVPFTYMPFGSGPRNCIGMRFALMEGKVCLVHLLRNFTLEIVPRTDIPMRTKTGSITKTGQNGIWLGLKPRKRHS